MGGREFLTAGLPLYPPSGLRFYLQDIPADLLKMLPQPTTPAEVSAIVGDSASGRDLVKLFVGQRSRNCSCGGVIGMAIGVGSAVGLARLMQSLLFRISPLDPITFTVMPVVLKAAAVLASYLPARRAVVVDPVEALRAE